MANEELLEEEVEILSLTDENGNETQFEYLDCIECEGKEYLVLLPAEDDSAEIVILEIEPVDQYRSRERRSTHWRHFVMPEEKDQETFLS